MRLNVEALSKNYRGGVQALRGLQLSLEPGVLVCWVRMAPANRR